jgi:CSLREA domain-containing protein
VTRPIGRSFGILMAAALAATALAAPAATQAVTQGIVVNSLTDAVGNDNTCTLREALIATNTNLPSGGAEFECSAGSASLAELIIFSVGGTITLGSDMVTTTNAFTLDGSHGITIDANGHRALNLLSGDQVWIQHLAIRDASGTYGGAIATAGHVFIEGVTITGSSSSNFGGAIFVGAGGSVLVRESTLSGNHAGSAGGAVYAEGSNIDFLNATLAGNTAPEGSALYSTSAQTQFLHATVSKNTANTGGGAVKVTTGDLQLVNSLVVGNTGSNLVSSATTFTHAGSLYNRTATGILDPNGLGDNGGHTKTIRLVNSTSNPAISHGDAGWCAETSSLDQRGAPRVAPCDDGAVELDRGKPTISTKPTINLARGAGVTAGSTTMKATIPWGGSDAASGIDRFTIQRQVNGGSWTTLSSTVQPRAITMSSASFATAGYKQATGSYTTTLTSGKSYRFRVRARDEDGNSSDWAYTLTVGARLVQQTSSSMTYSSGWSTSSSSNFSGGSTRYSVTAGKWARLTFTGRAVAFVTTFRSPTVSFRVYIDGVSDGNVELTSAQTLYRRQAYTRKFSSSAQHTIRIYVLSGRVDVDAFAVLR